MAFASMIRSDAAPHTEGYGNTRDSLAATDNRIRDNHIAEGDYVADLKSILGIQDKVVMGKMLDDFCQRWMAQFTPGTPGYVAAKGRLDTMITAAMWGRLEKVIGYVGRDPKLRRIARGRRKAA